MIDIEKMKAEFEDKLKLAELANELEGKFPNLSFMTYRNLGRICISVYNKPYSKELGTLTDFVDFKGAKMMLLNFIPTEKVGPLSDVKHNYKISIHNRYKSKPELAIQWKSNDKEIYLKLSCDSNMQFFERFLKPYQRCVVDTELTTYTELYRNGGRPEDTKVFGFSFKSPNIKEFYGGHIYLNDENEINEIIDFILKTKD